MKGPNEPSGKPFQTSVIFANKARAYPDMVLPHLKTLH